MENEIANGSLKMRWQRNPWDELVCGFPVLQINEFKVTGEFANKEFELFEKIREKLKAGLVSCRLPHQNLAESMLLEDRGYRFIEMVYSPEIELSHIEKNKCFEPLQALKGSQSDLALLRKLAAGVFKNERFQMDFRLNPNISDARFGNWIASSFDHPSQNLTVYRDQDKVVGFSITEILSDGTCYWHLNAVASEIQAQGYGRRLWKTMLLNAKNAGATRVKSSIAARNYKVLNLYASEGFKFPAPEMTFHWVRNFLQSTK
ncbi:GNAT family N-acetyltransferase [Paucibacter sp. AS339]|uniref:GNAT family N-acetyltransferase n=1 Tax=Paucibacter hankyongi TaxID=3133434 RepID=UPI0030AA9567